ncbi:MAG: hypothetical protein LBJ18_00725 [Rickettsiales bacterium]|jgi:outer membrane protein assembly factor BamE (lipoprotein component of BamABCDE complex)|nr:hypothetical protein [Rickettsiales bacterium]
MQFIPLSEETDNYMKKSLFTVHCSLFIAALCAAGCTFQTKHRGYIFPDDLEAQVAAAKTTAALEEKLGSPTAKTAYGAPVWIYYGADENYHGPFPMTYDNKIALLVWSNASGVITQTKILRDDDLPDVKIASGETEIPAAIELNALEELFNNIGRFSPAGLGQ